MLDSTDEATRALVEDRRDEFTQIHYVDFRDLGASRQFGIGHATAGFVFLHDGDDLYSENWYGRFLDGIESGDLDPEAVHHVELFVGFQERRYFRRMIPSDHPAFDPLYLCSEWYFSNKCVVPRALFERFPFLPNDIRRGLGNEDWSWSGDTIDAGIRHSVVPGTICFYRHKPAAQSLGLVPGMIHHRSRLYAPSRVNLQVARNWSRPLGTTPWGNALRVGRDFSLEGPVPDWAWDEVARQSEFEALLTDLFATRELQRVEPPNLHQNVARAWRNICDGMEDGPKVLMFFDAEAANGFDLLLEKVLHDARETYGKAHQIVAVVDDRHHTLEERYYLSRYNAKIVSMRYLLEAEKLEGWYVYRFLMRLFVQFDSLLVLDFCSATFAAMFAEFHRSICALHPDIRFVYPNAGVDLAAPAFRHLKENVRTYHATTGRPAPVVSLALDNRNLGALSGLASVHLVPDMAQGWWSFLSARHEASATSRVLALGEIDFSPLVAPRLLLDPEPEVPRPVSVPVEQREDGALVLRTRGAWFSPDLAEEAMHLFEANPEVQVVIPQVICYMTRQKRMKAVWINYQSARAHIWRLPDSCLVDDIDLPLFAIVRPGSALQGKILAWSADLPWISAPALVLKLISLTKGEEMIPLDSALCVGTQTHRLSEEDLELVL